MLPPTLLPAFLEVLNNEEKQELCFLKREVLPCIAIFPSGASLWSEVWQGLLGCLSSPGERQSTAPSTLSSEFWPSTSYSAYLTLAVL